MGTVDEHLLLGAHTSAAGGVHNALYEGQRIGATTIQLFTSNQKQWRGRKFSQEDLDKWFKACEATGIQKIMSHDSYLINLGSIKPDLLQKSRDAFKEEIKRCQELKLSYLNFHPGAAVSDTPEHCLDTIVESLLQMRELLGEGGLTVLLETTAGQGTSVGHQFEQLAYIIGKVKEEVPIGVCIDTCHIFAAGYDLRTEEDCSKTLDAFDQTVGLEYLYAFHLNDSAKRLGERVDRHRCLGKGEIGFDCFRFLMNDPRTRDLPKYLETPEGTEVWKSEIAMLRNYAKE